MSPTLELTDEPDESSTQLDWPIRAAIYPLQVAYRLASIAFELARPHASLLVPPILCALLFPLLAFFSFLAGAVVWQTSAVSWSQPVFLQYGDGVPPYAEVSLEVAPMQAYDMSLHLSVPSIETNFALGNFMASLTLATPANETLISVRRPALILVPPSSTFSLWKAKRTLELELPMLSAYITRTPKVVARVELGRRDHWKSLGHGEGRELTVLSATLRGTLQHRGVRGAFTRFPMITAGIASAAFFVITAVVVGVCLLSATRLYTSYDGEGGENSELAGVNLPLEVEEKKAKRRASEESLGMRRRAGGPSRRSSREVKMEFEENITPLRRRASRPSVRMED